MKCARCPEQAEPSAQLCAECIALDFGRECSDRGAAAREAFHAATAATAARLPVAPDPTKRVVVIDGAPVALYRVVLADGAERWMSAPVPPGAMSSSGELYGVTGRVSALIPAPGGRRHAENRARLLFPADESKPATRRCVSCPATVAAHGDRCPECAAAWRAYMAGPMKKV